MKVFKKKIIFIKMIFKREKGVVYTIILAQVRSRKDALYAYKMSLFELHALGLDV